MNLVECKNNSNYIHLIDLDTDPNEILCGANVWRPYDYQTRTRGPKEVYQSRNNSPISELDPRCKKCDKKAGGYFRSVTAEELDETQKGLKAMLDIADRSELEGLGPVEYALAVWLLDNGCAEERRGYGHISAADLAEKLVDGGWIKDELAEHDL